MGELQRKRQRVLAAGGMNWNRPVDGIPDGQISYARNMRLSQQGQPTTRPGLTSFTTPTGTPSWVHSMSRLNNYSGNLPLFSYVYVFGGDQKLFVGKTNADMTNASINPVKLPPSGSTSTLSGNPLTMVDSQTVGGLSGWKFVADSTQMMDVGYYPGDTPGSTMARAITMGMVPPVFTPTFTINPGGKLNGNYQWICSFRRTFTQARSNPSAASRYNVTTPAVPLTNQSVTFTLPTTPTDPQTGSADANIVIDVYRFGGTVFSWRYVGTGNGGASFTDNLPDSAVLSAEEPGQNTNPVTGLAYFNVFQPFPIADIARFNTYGTPGTVTKVAGADGTNTIWILTAGGSDTFKPGIVAGSTISINNAVFTIYQVRSSTVVEIAEDATGTLTSGNTYPWAIPAGTLVMGTPCPHIWGPYGTGVSGAVIFGCGAGNAVDTLFWTNGNDPDSADIAGSLVVTSPSEPLQGGCVFNGTPYVFSTERMFQIFPSLTVAGQYYVQEIVGGKGLWWQWSLTVQSNSIADQSISWVGKDGVYNFTGGTVSLTDETLYPLFPHDNQQPRTLLQIFPWINTAVAGEGSLVLSPDQTAANEKYHRLQWNDGVLFYDFPANSGATKFNTLVFDSKQAKGWVSVDLYKNTNTKPVARMTEIAGNNMKMSLGGTVYDYGTMVGSNTTDDGTNVTSFLCTRQDDEDDPRGRKLYFDFMFDVDPGGNNSLAAAPFLDYFTNGLPNTATFPTVAGRTQQILDVFTGGLGLLAKTIGVVFSWTQTTSTPVYLYQYEYAFAPKPEVSLLRATDKTDDGYNGPKYLRGVSIECNTINQTRKLNILVDGLTAVDAVSRTTKFTVNTGLNTQLEVQFGITPVIGTEFQIAIDSTDTAVNGWEVFSVRWIWERWPDFAQESSPVLNLGTDAVKYIRGFTIPVDTGGAADSIQVTTDLAASPIAFTGVIGPINQKTPVPFAFVPPVLAHTLQINPLAPMRAWYDEIVWDFEVWPEFTDEYSVYIMPSGRPKPFYLRGFSMPVDTNGNGVDFKIRLDNDNVIDLGTFTTPAGEKTPVDFVLPVSLAGANAPHAVRIEPQNACRCWYNEIAWDGEEWPERTTEFGLWTFPGGRAKPAYVRGFSMPIETNGMPVAFIARLEGNVQVNLGSFTTQPGIKTVVPFVFSPPVVEHTIRIEPQGAARVWYGDAVWDCEEYPELSLEESPVLDCGYRRAKFLQGMVIPIDTNGAVVTVQVINVDTGLVAATFTAQTSGKQTVPVSWNPFIAHLVQLIPTGAARIWWSEITWVFEPVPELTNIWTTPVMTHGMSGYQHQRLAWIAYLTVGGGVTFSRLVNGVTETYSLPDTGGVYSKALVNLQPTKYVSVQYSIVQPGVATVGLVGARVYVQDCEFHTKQWGSDGGFQPEKIIGSPSVTRGADI